jgi:hypothetical protein
MGNSFTFEGLTSSFHTLGQAASVAGVVLLGFASGKMAK